MITPVVEAKALRRVYHTKAGELAAVDGIDLTIGAGEFIAIMGPSGSGKTTLMNLIGCLDRPSSGRLLIDGEDTAKLSVDQRADLRNRRIGFVFQQFNLLARTSARDNILVPVMYRRDGPHDRSELSARGEMLMARFGLFSHADHLPVELSGGQQQRVAIARALINDPLLLLADEPTGALDSRTGAEILDVLEELNTQGMTTVIVTHDAEVAQRARRVIHMLDGRIEREEGASPA